mmetsp:Transcript_76373/g.182880  ORF Transcript_76373/g.182880 Transcript_76373/m.182880 type:complete len:239 (-) Transcript_76373:201-917(-)
MPPFILAHLLFFFSSICMVVSGQSSSSSSSPSVFMTASCSCLLASAQLESKIRTCSLTSSSSSSSSNCSISCSCSVFSCGTFSSVSSFVSLVARLRMLRFTAGGGASESTLPRLSRVTTFRESPSSSRGTTCLAGPPRFSKATGPERPSPKSSSATTFRAAVGTGVGKASGPSSSPRSSKATSPRRGCVPPVTGGSTGRPISSSATTFRVDPGVLGARVPMQYWPIRLFAFRLFPWAI